MEKKNEDLIKEKTQQSTRLAKQLPPSVQFAIAKVLPNITNGAFWGFCDMKAIQEHIEDLKSEQNITVRKLSNACLVEVNPKYILDAALAVDPNIFNQSDLNFIQQSMSDAVVSFEKFLLSRGKKGFSGSVGIYCTNNVTTIAHKGVSYPAFRLALPKVLELMAQYGYEMLVGQDFYAPANVMSLGNVFDSVHLSPTKTGAFINIKSTYTAQQYKQLETMFKQKYGLK